MLHGVDVSNHQPDWRGPASNDRFVGVLCSDGHTWKSPTHDTQVALVRKAKRVVIHYHWLRHGDIAAQAAWFVKCANPKPGEVLCCDWEQSGTTNRDKDDFLKAVKKLCPNNRVILYCNPNYWRTYDKTSYTGDGLWIAAYGVDDPGISYPWLFWQYADHPNTDQNRARFASKAALEDWANLKPAPIPTPVPLPTPAHSPAIATVGGMPLGDYKTSGTRIKWRPLYHNNNVQANSTCYCVTQAIAVAEARLKKLGVIKECLDFWQFGYGQAATASADTHAAGGVVDTVQTDDITLKVLREVGFTAAWYRGPGTRYGNFPTKHIHAVLSGCPHVSKGAKEQIKGTIAGQPAGVRNGRNGLANNGPDYGPHVPYITWQKAFVKFVTTTIPKIAPVSAVSEEDLDVATQQPVKHRSKPQTVPPTKNGGHKILYLEDNGNVSWAFGAGRYEVAAYIRTTGGGPEDELLVQAAIVDTDSKGKVVRSQYKGAVGLAGGNGTSFRLFPWRWNVGAPPKGQTRRLRLSVQNFTGKTLTVTEIYTYVWKAPLV